MMKPVEIERYTNAFAELGDETMGMTPNAAYQLLRSYAAYKSGRDAWILLRSFVPPCLERCGSTEINIPDDYPFCNDFWEVKGRKGMISPKGIAFVEQHMDVFQLLDSQTSETNGQCTEASENKGSQCTEQGGEK